MSSHRSRLAEAAVAVAALAALFLLVAFTGGRFGGLGLVIAAVGFGLAVAARLRHERWSALWLPLVLFPVLLVTLPFWV